MRVPATTRAPDESEVTHAPLLMAVGGDKTRAIFDRCNIASEDDLAVAAERTALYVAQRREAKPRVVALASVRMEPARFTHSDATGKAINDEKTAASA